jgi:shikimate kinase
LTGRPLSDRNTISEMMKKRLPVYRRIADYEIEFTTAEKVAKKAADIYNSLKEVQR